MVGRSFAEWNSSTQRFRDSRVFETSLSSCRNGAYQPAGSWKSLAAQSVGLRFIDQIGRKMIWTTFVTRNFNFWFISKTIYVHKDSDITYVLFKLTVSEKLMFRIAKVVHLSCFRRRDATPFLDRIIGAIAMLLISIAVFQLMF